MSHWNYRVIRTRSRVANVPSLAIHTVHYHKGKPNACSEEPSQFATFGDEEGLKESLELAMGAFSSPILEMSVFDEPTGPEGDTKP